MIPFTILEIVSAHQMPFSPMAVPPRITASGIRAAVRIMVMTDAPSSFPCRTGAYGHQLHAHEHFRKTNNPKIISSGRYNLCLMNKQAEYGRRSKYEKAGGKNAPYKHDDRCCHVTFLYPLQVSRAIVLPDKCIDSCPKTICCHPGYGFNLSAYSLDCNRRIPPCQ